MSKAGALIVGIIDLVGGVIKKNGYSLNEIKSLLESRSSNFLETEQLIPFENINKRIWETGAEIFIPAAASRILTQNQLDEMINNGLEVISSGANVPFADKEIFFGPISKSADNRISVIPDFIANCGMARAFSYLMEDRAKLNDVAIFHAVSETIKQALVNTHQSNKSKKNISKTAFAIALKQLI